MEKIESPFEKREERGVREGPTEVELRSMAAVAPRVSGAVYVPPAALRFQRRFAESIRRHPDIQEMPKWVLGMVEKKASIEEFAKVVHDRTMRAPTEEAIELAAVLANEVARMEGGGAVVQEHITPEVLRQVGSKEGEAE
jgi:hypothetical protein